MCAPSDLAFTLLLGLFLALVVFALVQETRFMAYLERNHGKQWRTLGSRSRWLMPGDGNNSYAGAQWYLLLLGEYKLIQDPPLQRLGRQARLSLLCGLCLAATLALAYLAGARPALSCLLGSWI